MCLYVKTSPEKILIYVPRSWSFESPTGPVLSVNKFSLSVKDRKKKHICGCTIALHSFVVGYVIIIIEKTSESGAHVFTAVWLE